MGLASLTKCMTLYTVIKLLARYKMPKTGEGIEMKVSKTASAVIGHTANLKTGDLMTVEWLMYGLMLPSGNDAAWQLAEFFGEILKGDKKSSGNPARYFMQEMNV